VGRFCFVHDHRDTYQVKRLCELVEVSRSGYYRWAGAAPWARAVADAELLEEIRQVHTESRCTQRGHPGCMASCVGGAAGWVASGSRA
jgi:hypothetical protein